MGMTLAALLVVAMANAAMKEEELSKMDIFLKDIASLLDYQNPSDCTMFSIG